MTGGFTFSCGDDGDDGDDSGDNAFETASILEQCSEIVMKYQR